MTPHARMVVDIIKIAKERQDIFAYHENCWPGFKGRKRTWYLTIDGIDYYAGMDLVGKKVVDLYIALREGTETMTESETKKLHNRIKEEGSVWQP